MFDPTKITENLVEAAKLVIGVLDKLRAAKREHKNDIANLFEEISACLATVSSEIRMGNVPSGKCGQIITYAEELPKLIKKDVGKAKAEQIGKTLHSAYNVEQLAMTIHKLADKESYLRSIEEASGKFQAFANILRAS
jgi:hypothetical protein